MGNERSYLLKADEIPRLREQRGLSVESLAENAGVHPKSLRRWLRGGPAFMKNVALLAKALRATPDQLILKDAGDVAVAGFVEEVSAVPIAVDITISGSTLNRAGLHGEIAQSLNVAMEDLRIEIRSMSTEKRSVVEIPIFVFKAYSDDRRLCWVVMLPRACAVPILQEDRPREFHVLNQLGTLYIGSYWEHNLIPAFVIAIMAEVFQTSFMGLWKQCMTGFANLNPDPDLVIPAAAISFDAPFSGMLSIG